MGVGIINYNYFAMEELPRRIWGFDEAGNPIDYINIEDGYTYIYQGCKNGIHNWMGIPPED